MDKEAVPQGTERCVACGETVRIEAAPGVPPELWVPVHAATRLESGPGGGPHGHHRVHLASAPAVAA
jgi:hypothetical protein